MKRIGGDLGMMDLHDLLIWGAAQGKTGSLKIWDDKIVKTFYLQEGKIVFLTSNKEGERIGEFLARVGCLELNLIKHAIQESQRLGVPFTRYLLDQKLMPRQNLLNVVGRLVVTALADALGWGGGSFEFSDALPPTIINGPIMLEAADLMERAVALREKAAAQTGDRDAELLRQIAQRMAAGDIDIPPIPDTLVRLKQCMGEEGPSVHEMLKIIMGDQILTSKILKAANSTYYGLPAPVTSLQHAIVYMGFKTMVNIVTAYALNKIFVKNTEEMRAILRHSLMCAYLAKKIGAAVGMDEEEAFVCGLLHDIGKTALLNLLADYELTREERDKVIRKYHPQAGSLLAIKWNFPELVRNAVRFHHEPAAAPADQAAAEIVWLADALLNAPDKAEQLMGKLAFLPVARLDLKGLLADLETIEEAARAII
ncbi:hypothetical protein DESUT3_39020 [Desulfuromonas versatilis]|uniref:Metal dependent phosphohydrolase n=1 Tax=Desulfuromonas versatilis TaxID=2802975 RepID=A0ABM8HXT1_9BACT|nr:HDOD domain-containing protein [Desulfuromonas versatilis]BCR06833.1 hypothetical protein DESUT3_39020 [Desulfuromonas versatilis]